MFMDNARNAFFDIPITFIAFWGGVNEVKPHQSYEESGGLSRSREVLVGGGGGGAFYYNFTRH